MKSLQFLALLCAFITPVFAETKNTLPVAEAPLPGTVKVVRNGSSAVITWALPLTWTPPDFDVRMVEIFRNTAETTSGRGRAGSVRATVTTFTDLPPDTSVTYWYWVKVTLANGQIVNMGPASFAPAPLAAAR
jgi:hypothetical protein